MKIMYSETERQYHLRVLNSILVMTIILTRKVAISDALPLEVAVLPVFRDFSHKDHIAI